MSTQYEIPNMLYDNTSEYFVHHRPLGTKVQGHYRNVPWSDIALQNVPLETTLGFEVENEELEHQMRLGTLSEAQGKTMIGDKHVVTDIIQCGDAKMYMPERGEKPDHIKGTSVTYEHTGRPIPKHTQKKYPTKPRIRGKEQRSKYFKGAM